MILAWKVQYEEVTESDKEATMKTIITMTIVAMLTFSCGGGSGSGTTETVVPAGVTENTLNTESEVILSSVGDVLREGEALFSTSLPVDFELTVLDSSGNPLSLAVITLKDENGNVLTSAATDENGYVRFTFLVASDASAAVLSIIREGYETLEISIADITLLESVIRTVSLDKSENAVAVTDSDGDGVPDELDAFPYDSELAFTSQNKIMIAFDGEYPAKGDGDFNDYVAKLQITENINSRNEVVAVAVHIVPAKTEAGHIMGININGKRYILSKDPLIASDKPFMLNVTLSEPVPRNKMQMMPYDPFLIPANDASRGEIHLPWVETVYEGARSDGNGRPWVIVVTDGWKWPDEGVSIESVYPDFDDWYLSGGTEFSDWYLNPAI